MATETRTDGRPTNQMDAQSVTRAQPMRTEQYDSRMAAQQANRQIQEIRPTGNETKVSFITTELWIYLAAVAGVLIASYAVGVTATHNDYFRADKAWLFITILTVGYLGSRGLAKAGSSTRSRARDDGRR